MGTTLLLKLGKTSSGQQSITILSFCVNLDKFIKKQAIHLQTKMFIANSNISLKALQKFFF